MRSDLPSAELDDDKPLDLAGRLRLVRLKSGVANDFQFAQLAGVARSSMSLYLNGKQRPKNSTLHRIAKATKVDLNWLLGTELPNEPSSGALDDSPKPCALLIPELLDSPVNFHLLVLSLTICQEHFKNDAKPTLRQALDWIAGPYALHARIPDEPVRLSP
ncbi:helix-turn-helix domain-containing protein [Acidocella sp.]|uniref:helix-turn-helix domain-containing protein n=1 Tax=Acidocella sp. TaxID=50710 RepID=UPI0026174987|nr:helix-turn-helix transcriptional regulator [Acidocella sp.]